MVESNGDVWREFNRLQRGLNETFGRWGTARPTEFPPINVWTNKEGAILTSELPGVDPNILEISVLGDTLTLKGKRVEQSVEESQTFHRRERGFGSFHRTVRLPFRVDGGGVTASYTNGLLEIVAPLAPEDRPRSISVDAV